VVGSRYTSEGTETTTTTYGYLTDAQFELACGYVADLLKRHASSKQKLTKIVRRLAARAERVATAHAAFGEYFSYLDANPPTRMKPDHGQRAVELHGHDSPTAWRNELSGVRSLVESAKSLLSQIDHHYMTATVAQLALHEGRLAPLDEKLRLLRSAIETDNRILRRYVPMTSRLKRALFGVALSKKERVKPTNPST
jgi:hypothetical protein